MEERKSQGSNQKKRNEDIKEEKKRSNDYQVNINPPAARRSHQRRSSTIKKGKTKMILQNNPETVIDTRRNNAWQSNKVILHCEQNEENKVEDLISERNFEERKILSIVNRELDDMRREHLNESQDVQDIGISLLQSRNRDVNQPEADRNQHRNQDSMLYDIENEDQRLI